MTAASAVATQFNDRGFGLFPVLSPTRRDRILTRNAGLPADLVFGPRRPLSHGLHGRPLPYHLPPDD
jgi:hypothetical protein